MSKQSINGEQTLMVCVRIRPMQEDEILAGTTPVIHKVDDSIVVLMDPMEDPDDVLRVNRSRERQFVFDYVLDISASQDDVYQNTTRFLIENVIQGYNATVFAYGATGAGKTHTMLGTDEEPGVMYRTMEDLFHEMEQSSDENSYRVAMSYLEIYNEMIRDLLNPTTGYLELREDSKGVQVSGLSEAQADSTEEVMELLKRGNLMRTTEPTAANQTSSRSHAVLQITVRQRSRVRDVNEEVRIGKLYLIDLAGSERAANTLNRGKRMLEGAHINRSLLALGNCINALADPNGRRYVNYRDSKLTRLLKDTLGGNCKTVMIAHLSPASFHFEESRNTLVYADRAKHIKNKVRRNVVDVNMHIAQYSSIISELRQEIFRLRSKLQDASLASDKTFNQKAEVERSELNSLKEQLMSSFQEQMDLRKNIMDLTKTLMEITLDTARCSLLISEWESEKMFRGNQRDEKSDDFKTEQIPDDVANAKLELQSLTEEQIRVEKLKFHLERELNLSRNKTKKMEDTLPRKISTEEHKEILSLLCKVHELEIENTEMQTENLLKEHDMRRRDLVITQFRNHRQLCEEIIAQQSQLLTTHRIDTSKELEDLMELYHQDMTEPALQLNPIDSSSSVTVTKNTTIESLRHQDKESEAGSVDNRIIEQGKVFSKSPKTKHIQEAKRREEDNTAAVDTLPDSSATSLPNSSVSEVVSSGASGKGSKEATVGTRSIAALAAQRRHRLRKEVIPLGHIGGVEPLGTGAEGAGSMGIQGSIYLSASRLEKYNRYHSPWGNLNYGLSDDNISIETPDRNSVLTDGTRTARSLAPGAYARVERHRNQRIVPFKPRQGDVQFAPEEFYDELITTNPRKAGGLKPVKRVGPGQSGKPRRKIDTYAAIYENKALHELETASQSSSTVFPIGSERGRIFPVARTLRTGPYEANNLSTGVSYPSGGAAPSRRGAGVDKRAGTTTLRRAQLLPPVQSSQKRQQQMSTTVNDSQTALPGSFVQPMVML